jgi:hypothetical protein
MQLQKVVGETNQRPLATENGRKFAKHGLRDEDRPHDLLRRFCDLTALYLGSPASQGLSYLLRSAIYSDTDPEPKTRPNAVIRIFDLSLYYAGLNKYTFIT